LVQEKQNAQTMSGIKQALSERFARMMRLSNSDDPLSSVQAVTRWADNLPVGDALKAQNEILVELKRFNDEEAQPTKERLLILMLLDEKSQYTQSILSRQYLRNPRMSRTVESQLWHSIYHLNWEALRAYHNFIVDYARSPAKSRLKAMMPIVTLRALRGFRNIIKWRTIRYLHPGTRTWARLHQLYQITETQGFHQIRLLAYPDDAHESTCEGEYLHTLMLDQANSGSLYPRQIDLIDTWIASWRDKLRLEKDLDMERHILSVDITKDRGARRVRNNSPELSMRYWSTTALLEQLKGIQSQLHTGNAPARLGLTENVRVSESLDLLEHLLRQWAPLSAREQRRAPRKGVKKIVEIVYGLPFIISHIKEARKGTDAGLSGDNYTFDENTDVNIYGFVTKRTQDRGGYATPVSSERTRGIERWVMEDESECGYGATIETADKDWLRVGALVGLRPDKTSPWALGVVRRLSRLSESESSVGIEILPGKPLDIFLYNQQSSVYTVNGMDTNNGRAAMAGLLFDDRDDPSIVIDPAHYLRSAILEYRLLQEVKTIQMEDPIDHGEGWIRVRITRLD
jgi:cyclic-di-GMP-binding protein